MSTHFSKKGPKNPQKPAHTNVRKRLIFATIKIKLSETQMLFIRFKISTAVDFAVIAGVFLFSKYTKFDILYNYL